MKLLTGIRVLDLTNVLSGPFATLHLALCGAEVIKIENPTDGDLARKLGCVPKYNQMLMGTSFLAQNANKKSVTLNLKDPEGKDILRRLVKSADVLVENFRPDVMTRLGLSYDSLKKINPRLIYCAISGFGQSGPDALKPAYDQIIQGLSGQHLAGLLPGADNKAAIPQAVASQYGWSDKGWYLGSRDSARNRAVA